MSGAAGEVWQVVSAVAKSRGSHPTYIWQTPKSLHHPPLIPFLIIQPLLNQGPKNKIAIPLDIIISVDKHQALVLSASRLIITPIPTNVEKNPDFVPNVYWHCQIMEKSLVMMNSEHRILNCLGNQHLEKS